LLIWSKPVFDKILDENHNTITNDTVYKLLKDEDKTFFSTCHRIITIFHPIKEIITVLELQTANLANCFINLIRLGATINKLSNNNSFKMNAINIFNKQYASLDINIYLLAYYLYPQYCENGLKEQTAFANWEDSCKPIYKDINIESQQQVVEKLEI
ncbi:5741_t:CDS:2, partial [Racocetra persica]